MIKDVLLVCALVLCVVLIYRIFVVSQKINNLEEKFVVLDNFSQTLFNYVSNKEESPLTNEITYSNNTSNNLTNNTPPVEEPQQLMQNMATMTGMPGMPGMPSMPGMPMMSQNNTMVENNENDSDSDSESETNETDNFETKEILSDMVSQLKESIINTSKNDLNNDLNDIKELKEELKEETDSVNEDNNNNLVINLSSVSDDVTQLITENSHVNNKKKADDLMKLNMKQLKDLAKANNIPLFNGRSLKTKAILVQDIVKTQ
jgi:molecular chaperone GrpE (heat shock protein)